jgi:zinc protease
MNLKNCSSFILLILFFASSPIHTQEIEKFGHEIYKVKPHPRAEFKTLKNGFRYIILPGKTSEKRALVYLYVGSGSLNETDKQQGLAHFLEHMAFNGTKNHPGESLVKFFKKMGMNFGGDTNAHTSFDETVYKLNLPDESYREDAVSIMSDYAMNILLNIEEIEKERGVILSEKRARDSIDNRIDEQNFQFSLAGSLIADRLPIGLEEVIKTAKREEFLDYYETWYRPENMVLIVVGEVTTDKWSKSIKKAFSKFKAKTPLRQKPDLKSTNHKGIEINYCYEKESSDTTVELSTVVVKEDAPIKYLDKVKMQIAEYAANSILNTRLKDRLSLKDTPFRKGSIKGSNWMGLVKSGEISVACQPDKWKESLIFAENELRKTLQFGFTDQELTLFKRSYLNQLNKNVNNMKTTNSIDYMREILSSISNHMPFQDALQARDFRKPLIEQLTKEDVLKEFKKYWQYDHRIIAVNGNTEIKDAEVEIKKVFEEASKMEVTAPIEEPLIDFPFEKKPEPQGLVAEKKEIKELNFNRVIFANNVVLNMKKTLFKTNEILFNINFGKGSLSLNQENGAMAHLASMAITEGGLTKLSKTQLIKSLTGRNVSARFSVEPNNFLIQANTTPEDFELNLQLCRATLLYAGFKDESSAVIKKYINQRYKYLNTDIKSYFQNGITKKLTNNNYTMCLPDQKQMDEVTLENIKEWLTSQFKDSSIEINVVGDIDIKKTTEQVATYFGSLPERQKVISPEMKSMEAQEKFNIVEDFNTSIKKTLIYMTIPTTDFREIDEVRKLNLLGQILNERTRLLIREKLSLSYSPSASHSVNKEFKNSGYFQFSADIEPKNEELTKSSFESIIKDIFENGVIQEDIDGAKKPALTQIRTSLKSNSYWLDRVLTYSTTEPKNIEITTNLEKGTEVITVEQINEVAKKYLNLNKMSSYILRTKDEKK